MSKKGILTAAIAIAAVIVAVLAVIILNNTELLQKDSAMRIEIDTPQKVSLSDETVTLDVRLSGLGDALYPAASMSISFDPTRLELVGVEEGNLLVLGNTLPKWSCNLEKSNQSGLINLMYLDLTGGKNAFSQELFEDDYNVVLRLKFRLRGTLREGDVCDIIIEDAVFAASDENESLASSKGTLKTKNGKIVIKK